jgi:hypothetical protein
MKSAYELLYRDNEPEMWVPVRVGSRSMVVM